MSECLKEVDEMVERLRQLEKDVSMSVRRTSCGGFPQLMEKGRLTRSTRCLAGGVGTAALRAVDEDQTGTSWSRWETSQKTNTFGGHVRRLLVLVRLWCLLSEL